MNHTPTPWQNGGNVLGSMAIMDANQKLVVRFAKQEDADFGLIAGNAHDELVAALQTARAELAKLSNYNPGSYAISLIDTVLAKVTP